MSNTLSLVEFAKAVENIAAINGQYYSQVECQLLTSKMGMTLTLRAYISGGTWWSAGSETELLEIIRTHYNPPPAMQYEDVII